MRVIAGSARGRKLDRPLGKRVRPTADRVKEALFSTLISRFGSFDGLIVLDLFAGSGALGIEALSRGVAKAIFVDSHPESITLTRNNLSLTGLLDSATLLLMDANKALKRFSTEGRLFDIIFADPPYNDKELSHSILKLLADQEYLSSGGVIAFETDSRSELKLPDNLQLSSRKIYGETSLCFLEFIRQSS